ncbi:16595_t:CDS:2 [Acaulospora colombiana]|uniref:16595_t:CDS:1 n=1 Tax=Acaulospora colombiana TaxID=27376 RepID=A0ACA9JVW4_9GLOM|nr:16595_t:CDS:2 [Acaulospora colombiana]
MQHVISRCRHREYPVTASSISQIGILVGEEGVVQVGIPNFALMSFPDVIDQFAGDRQVEVKASEKHPRILIENCNTHKETGRSVKIIMEYALLVINILTTFFPTAAYKLENIERVIEA